jgi:hypothetical protein
VGMTDAGERKPQLGQSAVGVGLRGLEPLTSSLSGRPIHPFSGVCRLGNRRAPAWSSGGVPARSHSLSDSATVRPRRSPARFPSRRGGAHCRPGYPAPAVPGEVRATNVDEAPRHAGLGPCRCDIPTIILTAMSQDDLHLRAMNSIAHEIAEAVDEKGFKVDLAMEADDCFTSTQARAMLFRDIVTEAAGLAASRVGSIDYRPVNGSGRELRGAVGNADRRYRIKRATLVGDELKIRANSDSALASPSDPEDEMLFGHLEQWVLGWSMTIDERIDEVFVAKVLGVTEEKPHWLILGPQVQLLTGPSGPEPQRGFTPTDDGGLPGFGDAIEGGQTVPGSS